MSKLPRRGRPPNIEAKADGTYVVTVKGVSFSFRNGRAFGPNRHVKSDDFEYAKALINQRTTLRPRD